MIFVDDFPLIAAPKILDRHFSDTEPSRWRTNACGAEKGFVTVFDHNTLRQSNELRQKGFKI